MKITIGREKEIKKELRRLQNIINKATDAGLRKTAKPAKDTIAEGTPTKTLILKKGLGVKNLTKKEKNKAGIDSKTRAVKIGFIRNTRDAKLRRIQKKITLPALASILSYGAKPHEIKPKKKNALNYGKTFAQSMDHPGVKGSGFFQKALKKIDASIGKLFYQGVNEYMKKHGY